MKHKLFKIEVMYDEMDQEVKMELGITRVFKNMMKETDTENDYEKFLDETGDKLKELFNKVEGKLELEGEE